MKVIVEDYNGNIREYFTYLVAKMDGDKLKIKLHRPSTTEENSICPDRKDYVDDVVEFEAGEWKSYKVEKD